MTRSDSPRWLTPAEVAALFRVDVKTVAGWARRGLIPHIRTPGGHRRFPADQVQALVRPDGHDAPH